MNFIILSINVELGKEKKGDFTILLGLAEKLVEVEYV